MADFDPDLDPSLFKHPSKDNRPQAFDPSCGRVPADIPSVRVFAAEQELTPEDWVWAEEGTLNPSNGHFLCDDCYIRAGMPSSPSGWKCP